MPRHRTPYPGIRAEISLRPSCCKELDRFEPTRRPARDQRYTPGISALPEVMTCARRPRVFDACTLADRRAAKCGSKAGARSCSSRPNPRRLQRILRNLIFPPSAGEACRPHVIAPRQPYVVRRTRDLGSFRPATPLGVPRASGARPVARRQTVGTKALGLRSRSRTRGCTAAVSSWSIRGLCGVQVDSSEAAGGTSPRRRCPRATPLRPMLSPLGRLVRAARHGAGFSVPLPESRRDRPGAVQRAPPRFSAARARREGGCRQRTATPSTDTFFLDAEADTSSDFPSLPGVRRRRFLGPAVKRSSIRQRGSLFRRRTGVREYLSPCVAARHRDCEYRRRRRVPKRSSHAARRRWRIRRARGRRSSSDFAGVRRAACTSTAPRLDKRSSLADLLCQHPRSRGAVINLLIAAERPYSRLPAASAFPATPSASASTLRRTST